MLEDSININNFNWNPAVLKKIAKTSKNYNFLVQLVQKWGSHEPHSKQKAIFSSEITKTDQKFSKNLSYCAPSFLLGGEGVERPTKFSKKGDWA